MNKKIISLLLLTMISSTALISCGNSASTSSSSADTQTESQTSSNTDEVAQNSKVSDDVTVSVSKVVSISDFKGKSSSDVENVLGAPTSTENNVSTYEKDGYKFEVTYFDSVCGKIKITPDTEMKYPADATNVLKVVGINAGDSDILSPAKLSWDNKYDTYNISVYPDNQVANKLGYIEITLDEQYK